MFDISLLDTRRRRIGRWLAATGLVMTLHAAAIALALHHWPEEELDEPSGAFAIELAPLTTAPETATEDAALGPRAEEAVPTTPSSQSQTAEQHHQEETPIAEPSPAPEPEATVPIAKPEEKKPDEKEQTQQEEKENNEKTEKLPQPAEQSPAQASAAAQAASPPKVEAAPAHSATTARQGRKASPSKAQLTWQKALLLQLDRHKRYPAAARSKRTQGVAVVTFTIDRGGRVLSSRLVKSSGSSLLDQEALEVVARSNPLPAPPAGVGGATLDLTLPIEFKFKS